MKKIKIFLISFSAALCMFSVPLTSFASEASQQSSQELPVQKNESADIAESDPYDTVSDNTSAEKQETEPPAFHPQEQPGAAVPKQESASGVYAHAGALYQAWMAARENSDASPYPDYICGVWSTDGSMEHLTFALTKDEAGEAGKEEILSLIADDSTASFTYQSYSYSELLELMLVLRSRLGSETGAYGIGIDEEENCICIAIDLANANSEAFMEECFTQYGNRVYFETTVGAVVTADSYGMMDKGKGKNALPWIWFLCIAVLLVCGITFMIHIHLVPSMQTTAGNVSAPSAPVSKKQTLAAIRKNTKEPDQELFQSILMNLDKNNSNS